MTSVGLFGIKETVGLKWLNSRVERTAVAGGSAGGWGEGGGWWEPADVASAFYLLPTFIGPIIHCA